MIGDDVEVVVGGLPGRRVQLGIAAPPWIKILRKALWNRARRTAAVPPPPASPAPPVQRGRFG